MKIDVSDFYKDEFKQAYLLINKEPRRLVCLIRKDGSRLTISYAKYLYTSYYKCIIPEGYVIDHINNDKLDDRIENYQVISNADNIRKNHIVKEVVRLECPICHKFFIYEKRNLSTHPNPCCSRRCGGKYSHITAEINGNKKEKEKHYCEQCGKEIEKYTDGKKFCSKKCREENRKLKKQQSQ